MCFRAPVAGADLICPECGKKVREVMGSIPNECPFCETDLTDAIAQMRSASVEAGNSAPSAPAAPAAPAVPTAPAAPAAPSAPPASNNR